MAVDGAYNLGKAGNKKKYRVKKKYRLEGFWSATSRQTSATQLVTSGRDHATQSHVNRFTYVNVLITCFGSFLQWNFLLLNLKVHFNLQPSNMDEDGLPIVGSGVDLTKVGVD